MPRLLLVTVIVTIALLIFALVDISLTPSKNVRSFPKWAWVLVAIIPIVGPAMWFVLGRPRKGTTGRVSPIIYGAPDDDPEFLRSLKRDEEQEKRIRELEEELNKLDDDDASK